MKNKHGMEFEVWKEHDRPEGCPFQPGRFLLADPGNATPAPAPAAPATEAPEQIEQCGALTKKRSRCQITSEHNRGGWHDGVWLCHVHHPEMLYRQQHPKPLRLFEPLLPDLDARLAREP